MDAPTKSMAKSEISAPQGFGISFEQYERGQISLIDQQFAQLMYGRNLPNLAMVFADELNTIDSDVYRLQIALSQHHPGGASPARRPASTSSPVTWCADEPMARVENSATVLPTATVAYSEPVALGPR